MLNGSEGLKRSRFSDVVFSENRQRKGKACEQKEIVSRCKCLLAHLAYVSSSNYGGTEATRNPIGMQRHKCRSCELRCKEAEKKNRNSTTLMGQKTFY
ncbi:hypothetical protein TNCV_4279261 [Trichonephila clavipes]|nr:hypothetical protein TNCV_4279261 [Trichonephila clavipes]